MNYDLLKKTAQAAGIHEIELYTKMEKRLDISVFDEEVSEKTESETKVFCIRGVYNNQLVTVYTEKDSDDEIANVIKQIQTNAKYLANTDPYYIFGGDKEYYDIEAAETDFLTVSTPKKIELLLNITKELKKQTSKYFHGEANYEEVEGEISIINSNGLDVRKTYSYAVIVGEIVVSDQKEMQVAYKIKYVKKLADFDLVDFASKIVEDATSKLGAKAIKSGSYKVVLQNNVVASLMRAFIGNFAADKVKRKLSFLENKINEPVFGTNITLIDDPFYKDAPVCDSFDDEGVATSMHEVVKDGVLLTYLHNLSTASEFKTKSTGNGFKPSASSPVEIEPTNFCLKPGNATIEELYKEVGNGVLITNVTGLHAGVNNISGDFNLQCSGYLIENGLKGKAVTLIVLSGKFQDMLNNVIRIANDVDYFNGMVMPSIYVKSMNISGV